MMCMCVSAPMLVITIGVIRTPYELNMFYSICMATVVDIVGRCGLRIEAHCRN